MPDSRVKLGFCPIGKFVFSHEDALLYKALLEKKLREWDVDFVSIDGVIPEGILRSQEHVGPVVEHLSKQGIDALFLPHCNFGTEGAAGMIAKRLDVPTLLWGPRDEAPLPDGTRLRDTLCGLFASSKVLHKLGVAFSYIENCRVEDPELEQGIRQFLAAANVANAFRKGTRIGLIGSRIDFFWTTIVNESELLERFNVEITPIDMVEFLAAAKSRIAANRAPYDQEARRMREEWVVEDMDDTALINMLAVRDQMLAEATDRGLEGLAVQDFNSLVDETGAYCFYADGAAAEKLAVGLESDIHGAISCLLLRRASMGQPSYLADITIRHPEDDNSVLLWHAGAPISMIEPGVKPRLGHHWILPSPLSGMPHFPMQGGPITVCRFDGDRGEYKLAFGQGTSTEGPETLNNYVWMKVDNWPAWERKLIEGPFIHHAAMTYGEYSGVLQEACRFVDGLEPLVL